jgi:hypothetical protein
MVFLGGLIVETEAMPETALPGHIPMGIQIIVEGVSWL